MAGRRARLGAPRAVGGAGPPLGAAAPQPDDRRRGRARRRPARPGRDPGTRGRFEPAAPTGQRAARRRAREQAQARFGLARDAVAGYYHGVSEDVLLRRTEFRDLRRSLLKSALDFYQKLAAILEVDQELEPAARLDLARADVALAQITGEIGSSGDALKAAQQARALFARLAAERPDDPGPPPRARRHPARHRRPPQGDRTSRRGPRCAPRGPGDPAGAGPGTGRDARRSQGPGRDLQQHRQHPG